MSIRATSPCSCGGECCGQVPASPEEVASILAHLGADFGDFFLIDSSGATLTQARVIDQPNPKLIVHRCCFFDPSSHLCRIYALRPAICREYVCDRQVTSRGGSPHV